MRTILPAIAVGAAALALPVTGQAQTAQTRVSVFPSPGVITASPATQVSFRGVRPGAIGRVTVTGSRSGRITGRLRAHSDGQGASWLPRVRFRAGETVTVRTRLSIHGARGGDFRFRTARINYDPQFPDARLRATPPGRRQHFVTRPDLKPPVVRTIGTPRAPGHLFLSPKAKNDTKQAGPMIADNYGGLIFFHPLPGVSAATDFRTQTYRGRPVLTYWQGTSRQGIGFGSLVIMDQSYRIIHRISFANGFKPDLHEFVITPRNTALFVSYPAVRVDLRRVGGPRNGLAIDAVVQEVDIETGLVVFEWHSIGRIALRESFIRPDRSRAVPFDYVHANSVEVDTDGHLLVSARNTWAVYKIHRETGGVIWRLGGTRSTFRLGPGVRFTWQHDARRRADGALTLFDNATPPPQRAHSRAMAIRLDERARRATLISAARHPKRLIAATQGNLQNVEGGFLVGWGSQRRLTEYDLSGRVLWDSYVSEGHESYRGYRLPWVGLPPKRPITVGRRISGGRTDVYSSWNGATEVASWEVLAGRLPGKLRPAGSRGRTGFETRIRLPNRPRYVAARARDRFGAVLGTSTPRRLSG